jgi:hypothetical protein
MSNDSGKDRAATSEAGRKAGAVQAGAEAFRGLLRQHDRVDRKVLDDVARVGWSDICVFPTENDPPEARPFNYTVGLVEFNHPDLILIGMENRQGHGVLHAAVEAIRGGTRFEPDTYSHEVLQGLRVAFLEVLDPLGDDYPMSMTNRLYGEVNALQLVWPDTHDRFPWDPRFEKQFEGRQSLLGPWRGE